MITSAVCTSFKLELISGIHDLTTDEIKIALYDNNATLNKDTTAYSATNESSGLNYTAGGETLTTNVVLDGDTYVLDVDDITFFDVTITVKGALIYNATKGNRAIVTIDFGAIYTSDNTDIEITFPDGTAETGLVRVK